MSVTHTITRSWSRSDGTAQSYEKSFTGGLEVIVSEEIPDGVTDYPVYATIDVSAMKSLLIGSDQDITIETNNPGGASAAADQTLPLKADCPIGWTEDDVPTCPLTTDVTVFWVTNVSGEAANFEVRALIDPTP